ncbi:MAG: class I SAM-dependent methyltransferase [Leptolinea sp.]
MAAEERRFDQHKKQTLIGPEREARWNPSKFLTRLVIQPGQSVLDLGSGPGFWTFPLAEIVGSNGIVWALDVSQEMLDMLAKRNPPSQVRLLQAELPKIELATASLDWVWAAFVLHEVTPAETLASQLRRILKADGTLAVLDWRPDAVAESGPPRHHRLSVEQVTKYLLEAGFKSVTLVWQDDDAYLLEAR